MLFERILARAKIGTHKCSLFATQQDNRHEKAHIIYIFLNSSLHREYSQYDHAGAWKIVGNAIF